MKTTFAAVLMFLHLAVTFAEEFNQKVPSHSIFAECDSEKGDERGPFGILYKQGKIKHDFLIMTGVYHDTCKDLEKRINKLKHRHSHLILRGSGKNLFSPGNYVWRWHSVQTTTGSQCISYFSSDCPGSKAAE